MTRDRNLSEGYSVQEMQTILRRDSIKPTRRGRRLRNQFELWARRAGRRIPAHLRMKDYTHCFCAGLAAAPGHENLNLFNDSEIPRRIAAL